MIHSEVIRRLTTEKLYTAKIDAINILREALRQTSGEVKHIPDMLRLLRIQNYIITEFKIV